MEFRYKLTPTQTNSALKKPRQSVLQGEDEDKALAEQALFGFLAVFRASSDIIQLGL
jgi:hypothetical protein